MKKPFVPLVSKTSPPEAAAAPFAPAPVVSKPAANLAAACGSGAGAAAHGEPQVTLRRENDRVTQIRIECSCGQVIELDCEY